MADGLFKLRKAPGIIRLHGHRAARGIWPENTLMAFRNTFDLGVQVVELDVLLTKDNVAVVTHNPALMAATTRGADGQWLAADGPKISDLTFDALAQYDVGGIRAGTAYGDRYPDQAFLYGQRVPKLSDVADLVLQPAYRDVWLNIEIKSIASNPSLTPAPEDLARAVVKVIAEKGLSDRVIVQSFDWRVLVEVEKLAPDLARSHLTFLDCEGVQMSSNIYDGSPWMAGARIGPDFDDLPEIVAQMGGKVWSPYHENIKADQVARAQALGLVVNAWTVNEIADVDRVIDAGVDGIITDYPGRVQRQLMQRGLSWREDFAVPVFPES